MSISYSTYVGPYVRCTVGTTETTEQIRGCTNRGCPNHQHHFRQDAYCNLCGSLIGNVPHSIVRDAVDSWSLRDAINEQLVTASGDGYFDWGREGHAHIWVPNVDVPWRDCHLEERVDFSLVEIKAEQVSTEIDAFSMRFRHELEIFRQNYGADAVSICWGIVQDYN